MKSEQLNYEAVIEQVAENAPSLHGVQGPTQFIAWAEHVVEVLQIFYSYKTYDQLIEDLAAEARYQQGWDTEEE